MIETFVPAFAPPGPSKAQSRNIRARRSALAMALAIGMHLVVIGTLLRGPAFHPNDIEERTGDTAPPLMIALALGDSEVEDPIKAPNPDLTVAAVPDWAMPMPAIELTDSDGIGDASSAAPGGTAQQMRYLAQIAARIERAWQAGLPPGVTPSPGRCDVWVTQLPDGTVSSIEQVGCTGRTLDATLLVTAVQRSSPLPAAPETASFIAALGVSVDVEHGLVAVVPRRPAAGN